MSAILQACSALGITVSEKKKRERDNIHASTYTRHQPDAYLMSQEGATSKRIHLVHLRGTWLQTPDAMAEIVQRKRAPWMREKIV